VGFGFAVEAVLVEGGEGGLYGRRDVGQ